MAGSEGEKMSYKDLGTDYICDACGKVEHKDSGYPFNWTHLEMKCVWGLSTAERYHVCRECYPPENEKAKKTLIKKFLNFCAERR